MLSHDEADPPPAVQQFVASGGFVLRLDFGYAEPASIGDTLFHDLDNDGVENDVVIVSPNYLFQNFYAENQLMVIGIYMAVYIVVTALSLPGAAVLVGRLVPP